MTRRRSILLVTLLAVLYTIAASPAALAGKLEGGGVSHYLFTKGTDGDTLKLANPGPGSVIAVQIEWADDGESVDRCVGHDIPPRSISRDEDVGADVSGEHGLTEVLSASDSKKRKVRGIAGASHKHAFVAQDTKSFKLPEDSDARDDLIECVCQALADVAANNYVLKQFRKNFGIKCN